MRLIRFFIFVAAFILLTNTIGHATGIIINKEHLDESNTIWSDLIFDNDTDDEINFISKNQHSINKHIYPGFYLVKNAKGELVIPHNGIEPYAKISGLQVGDVIIAVNGLKYVERHSLYNYVSGKNENEKINIKIKRSNKIRSILNHPLKSYSLGLDTATILGEVWQDRKINLAIVTSVKLINAPDDMDQKIVRELISAEELRIVNFFESLYSRLAKAEQSFSIVDRNKTAHIINEIKYQQSGLIEKDSQVKLGNMLGATHLLVSEFELDISPLPRFILNNKLIEIESGKVLMNTSYNITKKALYKAVDTIHYLRNISKFTKHKSISQDEYNKIFSHENLSDAISSLEKIIIPNYNSYIQGISSIIPQDKELRDIHKLLLNAESKYLQYCMELAIGFRNKDKKLLKDADEITFKAANQELSMWRERFAEYIKGVQNDIN